MSAKFADWTSGEAAIRYQCCAACGRVQYFRRGFCAACGATRRDGTRRATRQRRGDGLRDLAGLPLRDAGDPHARALQHRAG
jgi:hypothetical protein